MKKYLMTGIAALAMGGLFTSCGPNMDTYGGSQADYVKQSYEQKFIQAFGEPAPTQTWGFGPSTVAGTRGMTRAIIEGINDPFTNYGNTDSYYKTADDVPENAVTYSDFLNQDRWRRADWGGALDNNAAMNSDAEILIPDGEHTIKFTGGKHDFYVTGNATLNVTDYINAARIYVLPGKTFTLNMNNYINDLEIYVAANATLNYNYDKLYNQTGGGIIFNRGTVNLGRSNFEANQNSIIYNEGTINGTDITSKPGDGNPSYLYNYGEMNLSGKFQLNSCANFFNEGTFTVAGETELTQGNSQIWWINKGIYTTRNFKTAAWNGTMYNYCSLFILGDALMQNGQFYQMNGSYMEANRGVFNNFQFILANGSGVNIKSGSLWGRDGDDFRGKYDWPHQGFVAVDDNAKVWVRLGGENKIPDHKGSAFHVEGANMTFGYENVKFYSALNWFGGEWDNTINQFANESTAESFNVKTYTGDNFKLVTATPKTPKCGATWTPNDEGGEGGGISNNTETVRIIAEDLTVNGKSNDNTDFDFNDIVFDVIRDKDNGKIWVKFLAAGGQLPIFIGEDKVNEGDEKPWELHQLFDEANPGRNISTSVMMNTYENQHEAYSCPLKELPESWRSGSSIKEIAKSIKIRVKKSSVPEAIELLAPVGKVPSKIAVGDDYDWCDERQDINEKYYFKEWVGDKDAESKWNTWYKTLRPQE